MSFCRPVKVSISHTFHMINRCILSFQDLHNSLRFVVIEVILAGVEAVLVLVPNSLLVKWFGSFVVVSLVGRVAYFEKLAFLVVGMPYFVSCEQESSPED